MVVIPEDADVDDAARLFGRPGIDAAVAGRVEAPTWADRSAGLLVEPTAIVTRQAVIDEVGGVPGRPRPAAGPARPDHRRRAPHRPGSHDRADTIDPERRDPITGEAVVILAAVPLHDVGGGSRGAQIALELVRRGYHVTYVNRYPTYEDVDLGLRYIHPRLEQIGFTRFDADCSPSGVSTAAASSSSRSPTPGIRTVADDPASCGVGGRVRHHRRLERPGARRRVVRRRTSRPISS